VKRRSSLGNRDEGDVSRGDLRELRHSGDSSIAPRKVPGNIPEKSSECNEVNQLLNSKTSRNIVIY
jgi:hypothetical protein